jgi:hypothetical protein
VVGWRSIPVQGMWSGRGNKGVLVRVFGVRWDGGEKGWDGEGFWDAMI